MRRQSIACVAHGHPPSGARGGRSAIRALRAALALAACLLSACASAPPLVPVTSADSIRSTAPAETGILAEHAAVAEAELQPGETAYWLLDDNADALRVRIALADLAVDTLDIQYFIWQDDLTGRLLMQHVLAAADRGVRVRFFLDDLAATALDAQLAGLAAHPLIEVRIFNPWKSRSPLVRPFEFVLRMGLLNHRMHNKVFVADGRFGIVGGRNIGDRYFGVYDKFVQNDIDVMVSGAMLGDLMSAFDAFWNSELSHRLVDDAGGTGERLLELRRACAQSAAANEASLAAFAVPRGGWNAYFGAVMRGVTRGTGELLLDTPAVDAELPTQLYERFKEFVGRAERELILSSPYLVPDEPFVELLDALVDRGVRVRIVTNSLASNSHVVAHSAYKRWRRALLATGAEIYEMRADAQVLDDYKTPPAEPGWLALHTKAAVVDGRWSFVGSPNIDPRSMILNTEIGLVADDPALADKLIELLSRDMEPENSWRVTLGSDGWLKWWNGTEAVSRQPAQGFQQRALEFFLNLIPIKNQT